MRHLYFILLMVIITADRASAQSRLPGFPDSGSGSVTVHFYPNPASSYITFEDYFKKYDKSYSVQLYNFLGKKVYEFNLADPKNIINLSDFFRGIYIFQLKDSNGKIVESGKFQVNK